MALNITVFDPPAPSYGATPVAPRLDANVTSSIVTTGAVSGAISGPALVCLLPDEDQRVRVAKTSGAAAAQAADLKLKAGAERYFLLPPGGWYIGNVAG